MTKDKYLEKLLQHLNEFDTNEAFKHISEYENIIEEMLSEGLEMEEIKNKIGSPKELAQEIAEEYGYQLKTKKIFKGSSLKPLLKVVFILVVLAELLATIAGVGYFVVMALFGLFITDILFTILNVLLAGVTLVIGLIVMSIVRQLGKELL
jgi:uncharacterized membrane protein